MQNGPTVRAIRESLQVISFSAEHLAASGGSAISAEKITREVKKIAGLLMRLEAQPNCPLEKDCRAKKPNA